MSLAPGELSPMEPNGDVKLNLNKEFLSMESEKCENMPVFIRVRPLLPSECLQGHTESFFVTDSNTVHSEAPVEFKAKHPGQEVVQDFTFTQSFGPDVHQFMLFEETMKETLQGFIEGQNSLVFAYGNSGSGKTYTMHGSKTEPGIIPVTVQLLFECMKGKIVEKPIFKPVKLCEVVYSTDAERDILTAVKENLLMLAEQEESDSMRSDFSRVSSLDLDEMNNSTEDMSVLESFRRMKSLCKNSVELQGDIHYAIWVSFVEVYNERIFDLLQPFTKKRSKLNLGEDKYGNIFVKGVKEVCVTSSDEVFSLLKLGKRNLKIASTKLNYQSSRSHCIFNLKVIRVSDVNNPTSARVNNLSFCDLAGSERHDKTQNSGLRLQEAGNINKSLMVLGKCIEALRLNQTLRDKKMIPFRESKLTRLFSGFFIGKGRASMLVNISPSSYTYAETTNVLKFSALAKQVSMPDTLSSTRLQQLTDEWAEEKSIANVMESSIENESLNATMFIGQLEERDKMIGEILAYAQTLDLELQEERKEKKELETVLRAKIRKELSEQFTKIGDSQKEQIDYWKDLAHKKSDERMADLIESLRELQNLEREFSDDDDDQVSSGDELTEEGEKESTPKEISMANSENGAVEFSNLDKQELLKIIEQQKQQLEHKAGDLKIALQALSEKSIEIDEVRKVLNDQRTLYEEKLNKYSYEAIVLEREVKILKGEKCLLGKEIEDSIATGSESVTQVNNLQAEILDLRESIKSKEAMLNKEIELQKKALNVLKEQEILLTEELSRETDRSGFLEKELSILKEQGVELKNLLTKEEEKSALLEKEVQKLKEQKTKLEKLENNTVYESKKMSELQTNLAEAEERIKVVEEKYCKEKENNRNQMENIKKLETQVNVLEQAAERCRVNFSAKEEAFKEEISQLHDQLTLVKTKLEEKLENNTVYESTKISELQTNLAEAEEMIKVVEEKYCKEKENNRNQMENIKKLETQKTKLEEKLKNNTVYEKISELQTNLEVVEERCRNQMGSINELETQANMLEQAVERCRVNFSAKEEALKEEISQLHDQLTLVEGRTQCAQQELQVMHKKSEEFNEKEKKHDETSQKLKEMELKCSKYAEEAEVLNKKLKELLHKEKENEKISQKLGEMEQKCSKYHEEAEVLNKKVKELTENIETEKAERKCTSKQLKQVENRCTKYSEEVEALNMKLQEFSDKEKENEKISQKLGEMQQKCSKYHEEAEVLSKKVKELTENIETEKAEHECTSKQLKQVENRCTKYSEEVNALNMKLQEFSDKASKYESTSQELQDMGSKCTKYSEEVEALTMKLQEFSDKASKYEAMVEELKNMESKCTKYSEEVAALTMKLAEVSEKDKKPSANDSGKLKLSANDSVKLKLSANDSWNSDVCSSSCTSVEPSVDDSSALISNFESSYASDRETGTSSWMNRLDEFLMELSEEEMLQVFQKACPIEYERIKKTEADFEKIKADFEKIKAELADSKKMSEQKDKSMKELERGLIDVQNNLKAQEEKYRIQIAELQAQHEVEIQQLLKLKRESEEENNQLKAKSKNVKENKPEVKPAVPEKPTENKSEVKPTVPEKPTDNTSKRLKRTNQGKGNEMKEPLPKRRTQRGAGAASTSTNTDVTRNVQSQSKPSRTKDEDENKETSDASAPKKKCLKASQSESRIAVGTRASRQKKGAAVPVAAKEKASCNSPLDRVKDYVSGAVPKMKASVMSYLSPSIQGPFSPMATRQKKRLYRSQAQPMMVTSPEGKRSSQRVRASADKPEALKRKKQGR